MIETHDQIMMKPIRLATVCFLGVAAVASAEVDKEEFLARYRKAIAPMERVYMGLTSTEVVNRESGEQDTITTTAKGGCFRIDMGDQVLVANPNATSFTATVGKKVVIDSVNECNSSTVRIFYDSILSAPFGFFLVSVADYLSSDTVTIERIATDGDNVRVWFTDDLEMEGAALREGRFRFIGPHMAFAGFEFRDNFVPPPGVDATNSVTGRTTMTSEVAYNGTVEGFPRVQSVTTRLDGENGHVWWTKSRTASRVEVSDPPDGFFELDSVELPAAGSSGARFGLYAIAGSAVLGVALILLAYFRKKR